MDLLHKVARNLGAWECWFTELMDSSAENGRLSSVAYERLKNFCRRKGVGTHDADDIAQATTEVLLERIRRGIITRKIVSRGEAYLCGILQNAISDARYALASPWERQFIGNAHAIQKELSRSRKSGFARLVGGHGQRRIWCHASVNPKARPADWNQIHGALSSASFTNQPSLASLTRQALKQIGLPVYEDDLVSAILRLKESGGDSEFVEEAVPAPNGNPTAHLLFKEMEAEFRAGLSARERQYVELLSEKSCGTGAEIAKSLGVSNASVSRMRHELMRRILSD